MVYWLGWWAPNPKISSSKPQGSPKVDSFEVDQMSTRTSWRLSGKK